MQPRLICLDDARALADLATANREYLRPFEPARRDSYYSVKGQRADIRSALDRYAKGTAFPLVIVDDGAVVGRVQLSGVRNGQAHVGYWVSELATGRGLATAALAEITERAFRVLGLHRLEAAILPRNVGSRIVLERNHFRPLGLKPQHLNIAGTLRDCVVYERRP